MEKTIRIGTYSNDLALWRAHVVASQLEHLELKTEIIHVEPLLKNNSNLHEFKTGTSNIFTKKLDIALLNNQIDIAVHDLSEVPTELPEEITQVAVLKRGNFNDVLVLKTNEDFFANKTAKIATNSLRCKSQWLHRYPNHVIVEFESNDIKEQLLELKNCDWDGAIFSMSSLKRINLLPKEPFKLGWIVPAVASGTVMISALKKNEEIINNCKELNDKETELCTTIERGFLHGLGEDLTAPVGALATIKEEELKFRGTIFSPDGKNKLEFSKEVPVNHTTDIAQFAAKFILNRNGKKIMRKIQNIEKEILVFSTKNLSLTQTSVLNSNIGINMSDFITTQYNRLKPKVIKNTIENVIFTNQVAVESLLNSFDKSELNFKNIYCVGRRTKRLIEKNIGNVTQVENSAEKLANYLKNNLKNNEVTHFCGNVIDNSLVAILSENEIVINEVMSYKTIFSPNKVNEKYKGILFFSPAEIESYLTENTPNDIAVFCNGETTAIEAKKYFKNITVANMPTAENILKAVNDYFS